MMFSQIDKKLKKNSGETIVETLISVLVVAIAIVMISNAVITAGKINDVAKSEIVPFIEDTTGQSCSVTVKRSETNTSSMNMTCYETSGGYYYYE